ncbi:hypothetical protein N781_09260 [Pontibacillus halophilus JSM 076056 = DSM 19796]|uniref:Uncharacterized protein n=1 Tax=Pontibacillus halophilus JSM 076056 = DSM 19796 TaxID=1385510 RepID=A0A0A5GBL0_9BACI|nr:polysaccharide biosynthesis protein [Pontibacillus halophilus]KGX89429.1 hypothetical protein N781_09260 [Pontibacillus halophilus JSM 076056 = DSM 19796]
MSGSNILKGTMMLTAASFLSKFLGIIYMIPFEALVGAQGAALLTYSYIPYTILISVSTLGVPLAVSKFVSKYNSLGDYQTGQRMLKTALKFMAGTGLLTFMILFFSAESIAELVLSNNEESNPNNSVQDVTLVIKMVSFALLIIPAMSITRGFFQGNNNMKPTAVSQVVEQIVRIAFLLASVFLVMNVFSGKISTAVGFASFAAFIGALGSVAVLAWYWKKNKATFTERAQEQTVPSTGSEGSLLKELLSYAGPFVFIGIAMPLFQLVDMFTWSNGGITENEYAIVSSLGHKLVIIPVTLATGLSLALLPAITKSYTSGDRTSLFHQMNQSLQTIILLVLPASIGISILSYEAYNVFYGSEILSTAGPLLRIYAPVALFYALFPVTSSILQGINQQRFAVISLGIGFFLKVSLTIPFMQLFGGAGLAISTGLGYGVAVLLNLWKIRRAVSFPMQQLWKRTLLIGIFTLLMAVLVLAIRWVLSFAIDYNDGRLWSIVIIAISALVGGGFYLYAAYLSSLLERVLGNRVKVLDRFMKRRQQS